MAVDLRFNAVGDQFAACQRVFHPLVAHGDTVAKANGRNFNGYAASCEDAVFYHFGLVVQMGMTGNDISLGINNCNQRLFQVFVAESECIKQRTVCSTGGTLFN